MGDLIKKDNNINTNMKFDQKIVDEFYEQLHRLPPDQKKEAIDALLKKLGTSTQVQMFGTNQNVVGAYQLIITSESFEKMCIAIEKLAVGLKTELGTEFTADLFKTVIQALANAISK